MPLGMTPTKTLSALPKTNPDDRLKTQWVGAVSGASLHTRDETTPASSWLSRTHGFGNVENSTVGM